MATDSDIEAIGANHLATWRGSDAAAGASRRDSILLVALFSVIVIVFQLVAWFINATDYVGPDPDDAMRLVEVRDYLGGQGWFDLTQYRLGPEGGTLMHWSRLVDWPIAMLISFYGAFLSPHQAEVAALATWPLFLVIPLLAAMGLASYRLGGRGAMVIGLILSSVFVAAIARFRPGAIDHHNVQLILAAFIAAMLLDPRARASNFAAAAAVGALAMAIGVETTPLVALSAVLVAALWAVLGARYRTAAIAFGLAFAGSSGAIFLGTVPPSLYASVTCDTLSSGYLSLAVVGGLALAASAFVLTGRPAAIRFSALALTGVLVFATALMVAPHCLRNPLDDLDPLLQDMWLSMIREAQSLFDELREDPGNVGGIYAVGLIALAVCAFRIMRRQQPVAHCILFALIAISWMVSAFQVRGMVFANLLAFIPLSALVADLRARYLERRRDARAAFAFVVTALMSVPSVWTIGGVMAFKAGDAVAGSSKAAEEEDAKACVTAASIASFAKMPPGRVLSSFNPGSALLRFTPHSVLAANYHRNEAGMVAALKIAMTKPRDALPMMESLGVDYILMCDDDPMLDVMKKKHSAGLFARLAEGDVPGYLEELPQPEGNPRIYRLIQR